MFHGMRQKEFEDWVHTNLAEKFMFGVCQQGVGGLFRLRASEKMPVIKLPPIEAVNALSEQVSASAAARKSEEDSEDDL